MFLPETYSILGNDDGYIYPKAERAMNPLLTGRNIEAGRDMKHQRTDIIFSLASFARSRVAARLKPAL